jgi:hypothetical protein
MTKLALPRLLPAHRRTWRRVPWIIGLVLAGAFWLAGCAPSILGADPGTGFDILVTRGPIQPVAREGEDNSSPVQGALVHIARTDASGDTRVHTDAEGRALAALVPGNYRVEVRECPGAMSLPAAAAASVQAGRLTVLEFSCDTGIR